MGTHKKWKAEEKLAVILSESLLRSPDGLKGRQVKEICLEYGISEAQYYKWRNMGITMMKKGLEDGRVKENRSEEEGNIMDTIYTLNARGNCLLEVMTDYLKLSNEDIRGEINVQFQSLLRVLNSKSIKYTDLRSCLTPSIKKKEIILVFDSSQITNAWYGNEVFKKILPLLDYETSHSFLCGDYLSNGLSQDRLKQEMFTNIKGRNPSKFSHSSQYYFVYINNLTDNLLNKIDNGLKQFKPYVGYIDITFSCFMKQHVSFYLVNEFIKHKEIVICGHEDDRDNHDDINMSGYPFEENKYNCCSLQGSLFDIFLSYKIERPVFEGFERDINFAINSVSNNVLDIGDLNVEIADEKLKYLKENKSGIMKKADFINFERKDIESLIQEKIRGNYLYDMTYLKDHKTIKFNLIIEKKVNNIISPIIRLRVTLEYIPDKETLRLITMV